MSWSNIPATVPEKLDELSSCSVPVEAANVTSPEKAEASSSVAPAPIVEGSLTVKLFDQGPHTVPSFASTHNVSVPEPT